MSGKHKSKSTPEFRKKWARYYQVSHLGDLVRTSLLHTMALYDHRVEPKQIVDQNRKRQKNYDAITKAIEQARYRMRFDDEFLVNVYDLMGKLVLKIAIRRNQLYSARPVPPDYK